MDLRDQLQTTLGTAYTLERELGGGGMSRVFVAEENSLERKVVVKVLPPELTAGVNVDRFKREILLAAKLQHPHIVPVLAAGETNGLPFYTMPFVEGESLRVRLARSGTLPITDAIGILRDVAKALAYAHERGIVHRDIKPENVLLSGGSAAVADFGIAKALSASRTAAPNATLTQVGTSLGTPAYMAPEQAAADPSTDHRADIYAFGCMAYELLSGRPPFVGKTPQRLLAAQMGETPQPITELRPDTPPDLAAMVMQCLAKDAGGRPQSAGDLVHVLDSVTSGGGHPAMPPILRAGKHAMWRALAIYAVAFVVVALVAKSAIMVIGLPSWVFPGAVIVMALGLPAILFTAFVQRAARRMITMTPTYTPGGSAAPQGTIATIAMKASPHMSWRRTAIGGAYALGTFI
ncbi:MAG: serine/threonine-protein kinase, partial [Gemmatimonadaceae bacterium]